MKLTKTASGKQTIKLSKKEWQSIGKKAGWYKSAGSSQMINPQFTQNVAKLITSPNYIEDDYKIHSKINNLPVIISVFEDEYSENYSAHVHLDGDSKRIIGMVDGDTPEELIANVQEAINRVIKSI